jgi:hypothetical protein
MHHISLNRRIGLLRGLIVAPGGMVDVAREQRKRRAAGLPVLAAKSLHNPATDHVAEKVRAIRLRARVARIMTF